jgi:hypothetical protein
VFVKERTMDKIILSSGEPVKPEPGRESESGFQEQPCRPPAGSRHKNDEERYLPLSSRSSMPIANCDELLLAPERPFCLLNAINLSLPIMKGAIAFIINENIFFPQIVFPQYIPVFRASLSIHYQLRGSLSQIFSESLDIFHMY